MHLPTPSLLLALALTSTNTIQAAPAPPHANLALSPRQIIPFNIALMSDNFCQTRFSTSFPTTSSGCQVLAQPAVGAFATSVLPEGCEVLVYPNPTCTGTNVITVPRDSSCFSFGNKLKITALRVSGTCPGFQS
ncbi:hypothetical protein IAQ61_010073 [Plenodomus lingam]|uniref:Predicted protein n=1 Tax=Leptosphaeria maculans (strain JN3 / isolate v23.1.3 / race Av1-4-5-6-7-8) TaxID=985895 RepID=E5AEQ2_LEPMJ|nr:predicted protein [Plenodomus lingam JN3]KAH9862655.1 hypothetical protein IAQ61_010073 [Plenodomus lingam]CBY01691.1 predicted protein [Plenodomus lingam JN3]